MIWLARPRKAADGQPWVYRWRRMKKVLSTGITGGVQYVLESGAFALITAMIGYLGTTALAVTIGLVCANLFNPGGFMAEEAKAQLLSEFQGLASKGH